MKCRNKILKIILTFSGNFDEIKLCDFGVSLPLTEEGRIDKKLAGKNSTYIGTKIWSAPEVCEEKTKQIVITDKADIFAYGLTLWEMMAMTQPISIEFDDTESDSTFDEEAYDEMITELIGELIFSIVFIISDH